MTNWPKIVCGSVAMVIERGCETQKYFTIVVHLTHLDNNTDSNSTDEENIQMVCVCKDMVFPGFLSGKQKLLIKDKRNIARFLS